MPLEFDYFPDSFIALQAELQYHPRLIQNLQNHRAEDFEVRMAEICAYCDVVLDGDYTRKDFEKLADVLVGRLKNRREGRKNILIVSSLPPQI